MGSSAVMLWGPIFYGVVSLFCAKLRFFIEIAKFRVSDSLGSVMEKPIL